MKSLLSIIKNLSETEVEAFRAFLRSHCRNEKSKKLALFNHLVSQSPIAKTDSHDVSRQSIYQLKKRLLDELYAFLITQEQSKNSHDDFFVEMDCHKKLYCFKILFDKGIKDHALQLLNEVIHNASKHGLHGLYLEGIHLRNTHFPLVGKREKTITVSHEIKKLKKNLTRNFYISQYLQESRDGLHEDDQSFRISLMKALSDFDLSENEFVIDELLKVNHLFGERKFDSAYHALVQLANSDFDPTRDAEIVSLVHVELVKACICTHAPDEATKWMAITATLPNKPQTFSDLMLELDFMISLRSGNAQKIKSALSSAKKANDIRKHPALTVKWSVFSLFSSFVLGDYKTVIKEIHANPIFQSKCKTWQPHLRMLEILSIFQLDDYDWLYYKIDSFRKSLTGSEVKRLRLVQIIHCLKTHANEQSLTAQHDVRVQRIDVNQPWHPLGNELINYCNYASKGVKEIIPEVAVI